ncbi:MAG: S41 family peptidase, partial [Vulcanimicrobiaceae bacterium]
TFGKGVVQQIYPLPDHSVVKLTTARYFTPHNRDINHKGIMPDIVVGFPKGSRFGDPKRDPQLSRAITVVSQELQSRTTQLPTPSGLIHL